MRPPSHEELEELAGRAGKLALHHFRRATVEHKADHSPVTAADREVEAFLAAELATRYPEAGIVGEEGAARTTAGPYCFVLDPIDGTAAFVAGLPTWCVCIGLLHEGEPVAGVVHLPAAGETFSAAAGESWWMGERLPALGAETSGDRSILLHSKAHLRHRVRYPAEARSLGSAAYHIALVARGVGEVALVGRVHVWDLVAPGAVLAHVGGCLRYLSGEAVDLRALIDGRRTPDYVVAGTAQAIARLRPLLDADA
jgi:fructose-1,6-bisphosphatase/inositol monophosphatase family enzyme